jgi:phospholipid/cholesterol/gamma-HCH transport system substrate-binding protein
LAAKIIFEIDSYPLSFHFKNGVFFILILFIIIFFYQSSGNSNKKITFETIFTYAEGLSIGSDVEMSGIKIGEVDNISLNQNNDVYVSGFVKSDIDIPDDSILLIRSNGIFGKKSLLIEPGFGTVLNKNNYLFTQTKDSYSIDMLLRYLEALND